MTGASGDRMVFIKRLEARGFKSLGAKPVTLQLDRGLTTITGPNGSGKSNLMDAVLFCLGENNPKILRVNRLLALMYDGGPEGRRPLSCRVTLTLENTSRKIAVDQDTVTITRELRQTGESMYYLNGRRVTKNTVTELLGLALISHEGFNIVPQGMVTRVAELLPDEKRRLIEQIVGVAQFDEKKHTAMRQLQDADVKLQVAMARIGEIKQRVAALEAERNDQLRLRLLEDEIRWLKGVLTSRKLATSRQEQAEQQRALKEYERALHEHQQEATELAQQIERVEREQRTFVETVVEGGGGRTTELQFALARKMSERERLGNELSEAKQAVSRLSEILPTLRSMHETNSSEAEQVGQRVSQLEARLTDLNRAQENTQRTLARLVREKEVQDKRTVAASSRRDRLQYTVVKQQERTAALLTRLETAKTELALLKERFHANREKSESFLQTLNQLEGNVQELEKLRAAERDSVAKLDSRLESLQGRQSRLEEEVERALTTLERASQAVLKFETERSVAEQAVSEELSLQRLTELGESGALNGYVGRLDRLATYPAEYERAVLAAGRRWLRAVIVRDLTSMLKLAETAKRLRLGRITVIPISEIGGTRIPRPPPADGLMGSLAQVFTGSTQIRNLLNFLFGDVLVARTARTAYAVAAQGFRSVTLAGDYFEPGSRAFETGYVTKLDSLLALVRDHASVNTVKEALDSLQKLLAKRRQDLAQLGRQAQQMGKEQLERAVVLERLNTELRSIQDFIRRYERLRRTLERRISLLTKQAASAEQRVQRLERVYGRARQQVGNTQSRLDSLNVAALVQRTAALEQQRMALTHEIEERASQIRDAMAELTREGANLEHILQPGLQRLKTQIAQTEQELSAKQRVIADTEPRIRTLEQEVEALRREEQGLLDASQRSRPILEELDNKLRRLREQDASLRKSVASLEREQFTTSRRFDDLRVREENYLGELRLYGFVDPPPYFDGAEHILQQLTNEHDGLRQSVNLLADRSYGEIYDGYKNLSARRNQLEVERDAIVRFIEGIDAEKHRVFMAAFSKIDRELRSTFTQLTGGSAYLEIERPDDVFSSGVFLMTQFPGKIPRESNAVSGGEKTVSAVSFILAIQSVYPSPFYLFDEVDAHLDSVNAERLAELLRERAKNAQIIVATLRDSLVARANVVYGVYMAQGASQVVRYRPGVEVPLARG